MATAKSDKLPKEQQSSADRLPLHIREQLHKMIDDPAFTQKEALQRINELLADEDHDQRMSYSAVNRVALKRRKMRRTLRESREMATALMGDLGAEPQGEVGKLLAAIVRELTFKVASDMMDEEAMVDTKVLKDLSLAVHRLEKATSENVGREEQIRKQEREQALEEAAERFGEAARAQGMDEDQKRFWQEKFLGVR